MKKIAFIGVVSVILFSCTSSKRNASVPPVQKGKMPTASIDSAKKAVADTNKISRPKPYKEVITAKAVTDPGMFTVHKIEQKYFLEISDSILERNILLVARINKAASGKRPLLGFYGYAGDQINENTIQFVRGPNDKLFIKIISFLERSTDSSENGMYQTVRNSNLQPIAAAFDIKAYTPDGKGVVVDATDFINNDNSILFFDPSLKKIFELGGLQADKSYTQGISSFPVNLELQTVKTYTKGDATATYELNTSFVLLPKIPMKPRYYDRRVGYFDRSYIDFDKPQGVEASSMITRWRLEPKEEDEARYLRGELVEPKTPIVYFIDPATPKKWVPYLIQGVNDWQKAFEKAGFKNAIYALEAPTNDPEFSLLDARHNAIIYKPSAMPNASGPHVHDPRTGEILETHINWYHNVMQLIHDWYMVQASPNDPKARKMEFDDSLMGQLIRFVSSHEVGHTLGLAHNFGSSSTIPVDSLRSKAYVEKNGFCPSIMDYARFNYVAQPEDSISGEALFPRINVYDEWAIDWGYRWLPQLKTQEEEKAYMNQWIINSLKRDKRLLFVPQGMGVNDPRAQSEDLGDDAIKAGYYGIQNLKRVLSHLKEWTREPNTNYSSLWRMDKQVIDQYSRYIAHVMYNIGLYTWTAKTVEEKGEVVGFVPKEKQKKAVEFLQEQLFTTPEWLYNKDIFALVGGYGAMLPSIIQYNVLQYHLITFKTYQNLVYIQMQYPKEAYTFDELLTDLEKGIWKELKTIAPVDFYRRALQKIYAERLIDLADPKASNGAWTLDIKMHSDMLAITQSHIRSILSNINKALPRYKDKDSRNHLIDLRERLNSALDIRQKNVTTQNPQSIINTFNFNKMNVPFGELGTVGNEENLKVYRSCWEDNNNSFLNYSPGK